MFVLQFDQALQLVQLALQVAQTLFELLVLALRGRQTLLVERQLVGQPLAISRCAAVAAAGGLAAGCRDEAQVVFGRCLGRGIAGFAATGGVQLAGSGGNRLHCTTFAPGAVLRRHLSQGIRLTATADLLFARQAQHLAALHAIDVAAEEGLGVEILDRQHGLVHRQRTARAGTLGDLPERVVTPDTILVAFQPRRRTARYRRRCGGFRYARLRTTDRRRGTDARRQRSGLRQARGRGDHGLRRIQRRVEQHGVLAQQTTVGPQHLDQEVQVGLAHRLARGDTYHALAVGLEHRGELQVGEKVRTIDADLVELFDGRQRGQHLVATEIAHLEQLDFRIQRLIQG
ncbi:hypothetical protein D9M71_453650 [compost metagenome]